MSSDIPDWVRSDCRVWGRQKRRAWEGKDWHGNIDGYAQSLLGRIREERDGASQCTPIQRWPEVFWGAGLDVQRALLGMPEMPLTAINLHYVWNPDWGLTAAKKAALMDVSVRSYWDEVKKGEFWVFARLSCAHSEVREIATEISRKDLRKASEPAINMVHALASPVLSFEALQRSKISLRKRNAS
jgi:hypothetical protein